MPLSLTLPPATGGGECQFHSKIQLFCGPAFFAVSPCRRESLPRPSDRFLQGQKNTTVRRALRLSSGNFRERSA